MEKRSEACLNCGAELPAVARYCPQCSQKVTDGRESLKDILREFFESIFNVDNRFFYTLRHLFIPAKLTTAYFQGKHKTYVHPIRLLLVVVVLLIAGLHFIIEDGDIGYMNRVKRWEQEERIHQLVKEVKDVKAEVQNVYEHPAAIAATDSLYSRLSLADSSYTDTVKMPFVIMNFDGKFMRFARKDLLELSASELIEQYYPDDSFLSKLKRRQEVRFLTSNQNVVNFLLDNITWQALLGIPFFTLFLRLLYMRRDFYYVEHLVFTVHNTTVFFLGLLFMVFLDKFVPEWIDMIILLSLGAYIVIAMKRFYQQNWGKTLLKFFLAASAYTIILSIAGLIITLISLLLF
ncbi:MAG: DUF3667 domain-containing protein [Bacteroidota bacterium]